MAHSLFFKIPQNTLVYFAEEPGVISISKTIRTTEKPHMKFTKFTFMAGASEGQYHIEMLCNPDEEMLIAGNAPERKTYLYANDLVQQSKNKAVIFLSHPKLKEVEMKYTSEWLQTLVKNVPIHFFEDDPIFHNI